MATSSHVFALRHGAGNDMAALHKFFDISMLELGYLEDCDREGTTKLGLDPMETATQKPGPRKKG